MSKQHLTWGAAAACAALLAGSTLPAQAQPDDPPPWPVLLTHDHDYDSNSVTRFTFDFNGAGHGTYKGYIDCDGSMQGTVPHTGEQIYGWVSSEDAIVEFKGEPFENGTFVHTFEVPTGDNPYPYACWFIFETPIGEEWHSMQIKQRQLDVSNALARQRSIKFDLNNDAEVRVIVKNRAGNVVKRVGPLAREAGTRYVKWNRYDVLRPARYRLIIRGVDHWGGQMLGATRDTARASVRVR